MTTIIGNRGQLCTSTLSPHFLSPHLDFPNYPALQSSTRGYPSYLFFPLKEGPWYPFVVASDRKLFQGSRHKRLLELEPPKEGNPPDLKNTMRIITVTRMKLLFSNYWEITATAFRGLPN